MPPLVHWKKVAEALFSDITASAAAKSVAFAGCFRGHLFDSEVRPATRPMITVPRERFRFHTQQRAAIIPPWPSRHVACSEREYHPDEEFSAARAAPRRSSDDS
jgi:hypothetical protein